MKILFDESLPKRLKKHFAGFAVKTVPEMGWQGKKNGELMSLMASRFDVFVTADQNLVYQINLRHALIPIIVLKSPTNRYDDLKHLMVLVIKRIKSHPLDKINIIQGV
jgi:predicted nuclease of predicted toxin-antitoxin system